MKLIEAFAVPAGEPVGTVVWLHGMGQNIESMKAVERAAGLRQKGIRSVFLNAPYRRVGILSATPTRAWLTQSVTQLESADVADIRSIAATIREVVERESTRYVEPRVVLAGFSQGAAVALMIGLTHPHRLAGLAVYAPAPLLRNNKSDPHRLCVNHGIPVWIGHGVSDMAIPIEAGKAICDGLLRRGYDVRWTEYSAGHEAFAGAAEDLATFVSEVTSAGTQ